MVRAEAAPRLRLRRLSPGLPLTWLDVFAEAPLAGNQLAVVHDADGLGDETMLAFTREMGLSETTFVQESGSSGADYRNRIWDLRQELPFAGHPSLGTAVAVAYLRGEVALELTQETRAGLQPLRVEQRDGRAWQASMLQNAAEYGAEADPATVFGALGLEPEVADVPPRFASTGMWHLLATVSDPGALARARPDWDAVAAILDPADAAVIYLAHVDGERVRARAFTHSADMGEDPATGSAAGPLAAWIAERGGADRLDISQGIEMGRPSRLLTAIETGRARVSGGVHVIAEGTAFL